MSWKDKIKQAYDATAEEYCQQFYGELLRKPFDKELLNRFAEALPQQGQVADIGCGPGQIGCHLHQKGFKVTGFDFSSEMVELADEINPTIHFVQADMAALPVEAQTFDGLLAFYSLIHLQRHEVVNVLKEFKRVLKPQGQLLISFHGGEGVVHTEEFMGENVSIDATLFTASEMEGYLNEAGFRIKESLERKPFDFEYQSQRLYIWGEPV